MDYIIPLSQSILFFIPFIYLLCLLLAILQIPIMLLGSLLPPKCGKPMSWLILVLVFYSISQFFNVLTKYYVTTYGIPPFLLLIVASIILYSFLRSLALDTFKAGGEIRRNIAKCYLVLSIAIIPMLWLSYFFNITFLNQPAVWYLMLIELIFKIPVVGSCLHFIVENEVIAVIVLILAFVFVGLKLYYYHYLKKIYFSEENSTIHESEAVIENQAISDKPTIQSFPVCIFDTETNALRQETRDINTTKFPPSKFADENTYYAIETFKEGKKVRVYHTKANWDKQIEARTGIGQLRLL